MPIKVGDFNMWGGGYYTQEDVDRQNAALAQIAESNPDLDLSSIDIGPSEDFLATQAAFIAQQEAAAAAEAQAQAEAEAAQAAAQAEAEAQAQAAAEAEAIAAYAAEQAATTAAVEQLYADSGIVRDNDFVELTSTYAAETAAAAEAATEAAAEADAIANPPYDTDIYEKSDGYWYYRDEDGNEIDIGVRDEDRAKELLDNYEEVVNEDLTPLTDPSAYTGADGEPNEGYRFGEDGTVFKDIGDTWAQIYVNEDGENIAKDTGREKFINAVDWEKGAEGERREGLGGLINDVLGSNIAKGLLAVATGGASIPLTTLGTAVKNVADGGNPLVAFLSVGAGAQLGNDLIKSLSEATGGTLSSTAQNAITGVFEGKNLESIAAEAIGLDKFATAVGENLGDVIKQIAPDISDTALQGVKDTLASTITQVTMGSDLATAFDNAAGGALMAAATAETADDVVAASSIVDEETLDAMSEAETGATPSLPTGGPGTFTPGALPAAEEDQVDTESIFYPPEVDTTPLSQPEGDDPTADPATITPEDDAPVIGDPDTLETPADTDTSTPVITTAEEELAGLGLTDGAPPVRPTETLFGSLYSEAADNSLTFKGTDPEEFIKKLAKDESSNNYQNEYVDSKGRRFVGLLQFGQARLDDYNRENNTSITLDEFKFDNDLQDKINLWHINDIDDTFDSLDRQDLLDAGVTKDGFRAIAHLGGEGGAKEFVATRGEYDEDDELGTRLSDYNNRFGGAFVVPTTDALIADAEDTVTSLGASPGDVKTIVDQATTTEDEAEEGEGVDLSGQEQEDLSDPTTFIGPIGAGIGPETTDENFQDQLEDILEGEGTGINTTEEETTETERDDEYQKKLDEFNKLVQETIGDPETPLGGALPENKGVRLLENLPEQIRNLPIPGVVDPFGDPVTAQQVYDSIIRGEGSLGLDENKIFEIGLGLTKAKQDFLSGLIPNVVDAVKSGYNYISNLAIPPAYGFGPATPLVFAAPLFTGQGALTAAGITTLLAGGAAVTSQIIDGVTQYFVDDNPVESTILQQTLTDLESGTYDEIGPLITGTGFDDSGVDEFANMFTDATGSPYIEGTNIPYASQAAADGANIMAGTGPEVVDDLGIDIPASGTAAGTTLTDIVGDDTSPVIGDTPTLGTPAGSGTTPTITTTADTAPTTPITDETDQFATAGVGTGATVIDDTDQTVLDGITSIVDAATGDGGETIGQDDTDIGVGAGVGAGVIGTGDVATGVDTTTGTDVITDTDTTTGIGTDVVTGIGTDVVTGTGTDVVTGTGTDVVTGTGTDVVTGTETIADTTVATPTVPVLPPVPPAPPPVAPPADPTGEMPDLPDFADEVRNILYGQQVKLEPSGVAELDDPYDFSSIFGNTGQQNRFTGTSPYDTTDLLSFLRSIS